MITSNSNYKLLVIIYDLQYPRKLESWFIQWPTHKIDKKKLQYLPSLCKKSKFKWLIYIYIYIYFKKIINI
jgi:hypothetical protein